MEAFLKFLLSLVVVALALIPTWLFLYASNALNPTDFWQKVVVYGVGLYLLFGVQFVLGIGAIMGLIFLWNSDRIL